MSNRLLTQQLPAKLIFFIDSVSVFCYTENIFPKNMEMVVVVVAATTSTSATAVVAFAVLFCDFSFHIHFVSYSFEICMFLVTRHAQRFTFIFLLTFKPVPQFAFKIIAVMILLVLTKG
jgi:hypothetical protein